MNPVLVVIAVILLVLYLIKVATKRPPNFPPGPPSLPIYGAHWLLLLVNWNYIHKAIDYMARKYRAKVLGFYLGPYATVVACDQESIRQVLTRPEFQGRVDSFVVRARQFGKAIGFFLIDGPLWKYQRRFALRHMRDFGFGCRNARQESLVQTQIQDILDVLHGKKIDKEVFRDGYALVPDLFCHIFLNSLWDMFCGDAYTHNNHSLSHLLVHRGFHFHRNTDVVGGALGITPWLRYLAPDKSGYKGMQFANNYMLECLQKSLDEHLSTYSEDDMRDFIDVFIREMKEAEKNGETTDFTVEQLLVVGLDLLLPTLTTVNATLGFAIQCLLCHPYVQVKMQKELDTVVGRDRLPTLDDRIKLPFLEATMREVMRYKPILPLGVARRAMEDTELCGYFVPKDSMVLAGLYTYNNDPEVWKDPKVFRPERFLDETGKYLVKDMTFPFGGGKRLCAGETFSRQNMFLIMAAVLQNFSFVGPIPDLAPVNGLVVFPKDFWVRVQPRT